MVEYGQSGGGAAGVRKQKAGSAQYLDQRSTSISLYRNVMQEHDAVHGTNVHSSQHELLYLDTIRDQPDLLLHSKSNPFQ